MWTTCINQVESRVSLLGQSYFISVEKKCLLIRYILNFSAYIMNTAFNFAVIFSKMFSGMFQ